MRRRAAPRPPRSRRTVARSRAPSEPRACDGSTPTTAGRAASPWPIPAIRVPPANLQLDDYGYKGPAAMLLPPFHWARRHRGPAGARRCRGLRRGGPRGRARVRAAEPRRAHALRPRAGPSARTAPRGAGVHRDRRAAAERARASRSTGSRRRAGPRRGPRAAGDWFRVDLPAARSLRGVRLSADNPADLPPELVVEGSLDGVRWERLAATRRPEHRYRWGGFGVLDDGSLAAPARVPAGHRAGAPPGAAGGRPGVRLVDQRARRVRRRVSRAARRRPGVRGPRSGR